MLSDDALVVITSVFASTMFSSLSRRAFATAAANPLAGVKPLKPLPQQLTGALGTYTSALWSAAAEKNATAAVQRDAQTFLTAIKEPSLARFINNPFVAKADRAKALAPLVQKLGFHEVSKNFLNVLINSNRLNGAPDVFQAYLDAVKAADGKIEGVITTAQVSVPGLPALPACLRTERKTRKKIHERKKNGEKNDPTLTGCAASVRRRVCRRVETDQHRHDQSARPEQQGREPPAPCRPSARLGPARQVWQL